MHLNIQQRRALAARLKAHLKSSNTSFTKLAAVSGINNNTIAKLTKPERFVLVQDSTAKKLAKAIGKPWESLIEASAPAPAKTQNGHARIAPAATQQMRRMLVIELGGNKILVPAEGVEVAILNSSTIRVR